jgi:hypothetical protein
MLIRLNHWKIINVDTSWLVKDYPIIIYVDTTSLLNDYANISNVLRLDYWKITLLLSK